MNEILLSFTLLSPTKFELKYDTQKMLTSIPPKSEIRIETYEVVNGQLVKVKIRYGYSQNEIVEYVYEEKN
jgi:hypothetical protein